MCQIDSGLNIVVFRSDQSAIILVLHVISCMWRWKRSEGPRTMIALRGPLFFPPSVAYSIRSRAADCSDDMPALCTHRHGPASGLGAQPGTDDQRCNRQAWAGAYRAAADSFAHRTNGS